MSLQALPYIGISPMFDSVIQNYLTSGASTTSASPVTASTTPTPQTLVLASGTGFAAGNVIIVDVDTRQERATVQSLSGSSAVVQLSKTHSGTYPVTVEGGESIIRERLNQLNKLNGPGGTLEKLRSRVGIAKVDEIEFFGGGNGKAVAGKDPLTQVLQLIEYWRDELAEALGVERRNRKSSGGQTCEVY
jgi:hypothetical protein